MAGVMNTVRMTVLKTTVRYHMFKMKLRMLRRARMIKRDQQHSCLCQWEFDQPQPTLYDWKELGWFE